MFSEKYPQNIPTTQKVLKVGNIHKNVENAGKILSCKVMEYGYPAM